MKKSPTYTSESQQNEEFNLGEIVDKINAESKELKKLLKKVKDRGYTIEVLPYPVEFFKIYIYKMEAVK